MSNAAFFVTDENYTEIDNNMILSATGGKELYNEFDTYRKAAFVARRVSKMYEGRYGVTVACPSTQWENGKEVD